jgi:hypothetical protein
MIANNYAGMGMQEVAGRKDSNNNESGLRVPQVISNVATVFAPV